MNYQTSASYWGEVFTLNDQYLALCRALHGACHDAVIANAHGPKRDAITACATATLKNVILLQNDHSMEVAPELAKHVPSEQVVPDSYMEYLNTYNTLCAYTQKLKALSDTLQQTLGY